MDGVRRFFLIGLMLALRAGVWAQVTLQARIVRQVWCVPATIEGRAASLLVDTGADDTIVLPGVFKQPWKGTIRLGRIEIRTKIRVMNLPVLRALAPDMHAPVVGILGMDVLRDMAVGFDSVAATISFWPRGRLSRAVCRKWLQDAPLWPGTRSANMRSLWLDQSMGHRMGFSSIVGGQAARMILDTGSSGATLVEDVAKRAKPVTAYSEPLHALYVSSASKAQVVPSARIGDEPLPWLFFRTQPSGTYRGQPGSPQGVYGLTNLRSRRALIDLPARMVHAEDIGEEPRLSLFFTELIELPVRLSGPALRIGPVYAGPAASFLKPMEGQSVVSIAGLSAGKIVALLKTPSEANASALASLIRATRRSFWVVVRQGKGTYKFQVRRG